MARSSSGGKRLTKMHRNEGGNGDWRPSSATGTWAICATVMIATIAVAQPDDDRSGSRRHEPKREFRSSNERFELKIEPARSGRSRAMGCKATLTELRYGGAEGREAQGREYASENSSDEAQADDSRDDDRKRGREDARRDRGRSRWSRVLVNDVAPVEAAIRDDGRFVVTLGEHPGTGPRNALVIYGRRGELLRHFLLTDMLEEDDWEPARGDSGKLRWLEGAEWEFTREPEHFVLRLEWGREVRVDLNTLQLVSGDGRERGPGARGLEAAPGDVRAALRSGGRGGIEGVSALRDGAGGMEWISSEGEGLESEDDYVRELLRDFLAAGAHGEESSSIRALLEEAGATVLISDDGNPEMRAMIEQALEAARLEHAGLDEDGADPMVRVALDGPDGVESISMAAIETLMWNEGDSSVQVDPRSGSLTLIGPDGAQTLLKVAGSATMTDDDDVFVQRASEPLFFPPAPDPAAPVDYMSWLRDQTRTEGENAGPLFQLAVDTFIPFSGDEALREAALKGDPEALRSPEIGAWLASNRDALEAARAGSKLEYRGPDLVSPSGDMVGILLPNLGATRDIARAMSIEGRRAAANGDIEGAIRNFMDIDALGASTGQGPTMIENLVGVAIQSQAQTGLYDLMEHHQDGSLDYAALAKRLESDSRAPRPLSETVTTEAAFYMDMVQRVFSPGASPGTYDLNPEGVEYLAQMISPGDGGESPNASSMAAELSLQEFQRTVEVGERFYAGMAEAIELPYSEAQAAINRMSAEIEAESNPLVRTLMPSFQRSHQLRTRLEADRRGTQLVANLMAYKQEHGAFPESLDVFAGRDFANDPFTNQRFRYSRTSNGFSLYSNGMNGTDEGGVKGSDGGRDGDHVIWPRARE